ncbi:hypothetical protein KKC16_02000 [Patescibacteria group bacterium]|nr:hypothetical protein [Patescibacteria group bacterium]MBU4482202.1 hypothetical protein [Patescibacteria group bacterium]
MVKLKNNNKAVNRLVFALKNSEKIAIWSDYDPDGVFALVLAYEALVLANFKKNNIKLILPNQQKYKRSFNKFNLSLLKNMGIKLILGIDFGTTDFEQIAMAKKMGFEIILLDHHRQRSGKLPALLVNPWQKGDNSKSKNWSGTGVAYLFFQNLYKYLKINIKKLEDNSIDLLLIPTITDYIKIDKRNLPYLKKSLKKIKKCPRPGIKNSLINLDLYKKLSIKNLIKNRWKLGDFFGTLEGNGNRNNILRLLLSRDNKKTKLDVKNIKKEMMLFEKCTNKFANQGIKKFVTKSKNKFIFWGINKEIDFPGAIAKISNKLNDYFKIPVFFYCKEKNIIKGSVRDNYSKNTNIITAMKNCESLFIDFGGHPKSAGFYTKNKNLSAIQKSLKKFYEKNI